MALDGIVIANVVNELTPLLVNGRINKIAQPENDELILTIKNNKEQYRLLMSANASLPLLYVTDSNKPAPLTAPGFCMLLRKHINNGKIISISQSGLERMVDFEIEHLNEMGDTCRKHLIIELMGKHSNIIFCDNDNKIIDSIKHISAQVSSVREVLPGRTYFIPETLHKCNPLSISYEDFDENVYGKSCEIQKALYSSLTGISPCVATEICHLASIAPDRHTTSLSDNEKIHLFNIFSGVISDIKEHVFNPCIVYNKNRPVEFASIPLTNYEEYELKTYDSICTVLSEFYSQKDTFSRIHQKSADLRKIVSTLLSRDRKKLELMEKQLEDTKKRENFRIYGELINTYGYNIPEKSRSFTALNYYTNEEITIPLDENLTPRENSVKYFDKYNKLKRTFEATTSLIKEVSEEIDHLESISTALDIAVNESDLAQIKDELCSYGYIKRKVTNKKERFASKPFHYISSDGYHMYVGKNNYQNEDLTFKLAVGNDWWFHIKGLPGSHVIVKSGNDELPDSTFEEAAALAAHYSKAKDQEKAEVDYTQKKNIKKPGASKPGFVIYHTNYSMNISPDISNLPITQVND